MATVAQLLLARSLDDHPAILFEDAAYSYRELVEAAGLRAAAANELRVAPRFVRLVRAMPLTGTNKVAKQSLRIERWETPNPVWWQPEGGRPYRLLTPDDAFSLRGQFEGNGRVSLLAVV